MKHRFIPSRWVPTLVLALVSGCAGAPLEGEASKASSVDPADWPGPVLAAVDLRFGTGGNSEFDFGEPIADGTGLRLPVQSAPAAWGARTKLALPVGAAMALGPEQYLALEVRVEAESDPRLLIQLDEPREDFNFRGLLVLEVPADGEWHALTANLLRNELSGDRRPGSRIMPDGTPLTSLGMLFDPRVAAGSTLVEIRNVRLYRQDPLAGAPVDASDSAGQTALHRAAMMGDADRCRELLGRGANVDARNDYLHTPLAHAVIAHAADVVEILIDAGADVSVQRRLGFTPLYDAAAEGQIEIMKLLMDAGADPTQRTEYGFEPLFTAVHHGHVEASEMLIDDARVDVNRPIAKFMPLHVAAQGDDNGPHSELYERLIELGAEVDPCSAAAAGDDQRVREFLQRDPESAKTVTILGGWTPLHDAVRNTHVSTVEMLLAAGADPNAVSGDVDFESVPLHWLGNNSSSGLEKARLDILRLLVDAGVDPNVRDKFGNTPLDRVSGVDDGLVEALRDLGAKTGDEMTGEGGGRPR